MILAGLEKTYESDNGVGLVDKRYLSLYLRSVGLIVLTMSAIIEIGSSNTN
jgi:hypothetical protein